MKQDGTMVFSPYGIPGKTQFSLSDLKDF